MFKRNNKKGQSTIEYVVLATAVIAVILSLVIGDNAPFQAKLETTVNTAIDDMGNMGDRLSHSYGESSVDSVKD